MWYCFDVCRSSRHNVYVFTSFLCLTHTILHNRRKIHNNSYLTACNNMENVEGNGNSARAREEVEIKNLLRPSA